MTLPPGNSLQPGYEADRRHLLTHYGCMRMADYIDQAISAIIAVAAGWLLKSFTSASKKELDEVKREMKSFVTTRDLEKEMHTIDARLGRLEAKLDKALER